MNNRKSPADENAVAKPAKDPTPTKAEPSKPEELLDSMVSLLRQYPVCDDIHVATEKVLKGYRFKAFEDAWERYLPSLPGR